MAHTGRKSSFSPPGKGILLFLWRHWAPMLIAVLGLLAAWTGFRMWKVGFPDAMAKLPMLAVWLVLIVLVVVVRYALKRYTRAALERGKASLRKKVAQEVVQEGLSRAGGVVDEGIDRAGDVLEQGVEKAKATLADLSQEAKETWATQPLGQKDAGQVVSLRCPSCGAPVRRGARFCANCGATLSPTCPHCGRRLRPGAKFCDGCGAPVRPEG